MHFDLPGGQTFDLPDDVTSIEESVRAALSNPLSAKEIESVAYLAGFSKFETWQDMGEATANDIAEAFFLRGLDVAEDTIIDLAGDANDAASYYDQYHYKHHSVAALVDAIASPIIFQFGADDDEVLDLVRDGIRDAVIAKMEEDDTSKPTDVIPGHVRVECVHIFGRTENVPSDDDLLLSFEGRVLGPRSVMPNERLARLFEAVNVPVDEFIAHMRDENGVDLRAGATDRKTVNWLAQAEHRPDSSHAIGAAKERATAWTRFKPKHDPERPPLLSAKRLAQMLEEASYGGFPCFVARMKLSDIIRHDWNQALIVSPAANSGGHGGGFVGVYDPFNGSGDIAHIDKPIALPPGRAAWQVSGRFGYAVDSVFGIVGSYYHADPKPDPTRPGMVAEVADEPEAAPALVF